MRYVEGTNLRRVLDEGRLDPVVVRGEPDRAVERLQGGRAAGTPESTSAPAPATPRSRSCRLVRSATSDIIPEQALQ